MSLFYHLIYFYFVFGIIQLHPDKNQLNEKNEGILGTMHVNLTKEIEQALTTAANIDFKEFCQQVLSELSALISQLPQETSQVALDYLHFILITLVANGLFLLAQKIHLDADDTNYKDVIKNLSWMIPVVSISIWSRLAGVTEETGTTILRLSLFLALIAIAVTHRGKKGVVKNAN